MGRPLVLFSGTAGSYLIRTTNLHGGNADYTVVELNIRPTASTDNHALVGQHFGTNDFSGSDEDANVRYNGGILRLQVTAYTAYTGASAQGSTALTEDAVIQCVALRRSGTTVDVLLNGVVEASVTHDAAGAGRVAMEDFGIAGTVYGAGETVDIGAVFVFERALSDDEIKWIALLGVPRDARGLHAYYPNYPGAIGKEASGRGRDFTVVNSPSASSDGTSYGIGGDFEVEYSFAPPSGATGTSSLSIPMLTMSASAIVKHTATSSMNMLLPTMSATGEDKHIATSSMTIPLPTMSATGNMGYAGTSAMTIPMLTMTSTGVSKHIATSSMTLPMLTMSASGVEEHSATSSMTIPLLTMSATANLGYNATSSMNMLLPTMSATGIAQAVAIVIAISSSSGSRKRSVKRRRVRSNDFVILLRSSLTGTAAMSIPLLTMSATGTAADNPTASSNISIPMLTMTAVGNLTYNGSSAMTMPLPTMSATGVDKHTATSSMNMLLPTMSASGTASAGPTSTSANLTIPLLTLSATGSLTYVGTSSMTVPMLTLACSAIVKHQGSSAINLPVLTMTGQGREDHIYADVSLSMLVPTMSASGTLTSGSEVVNDIYIDRIISREEGGTING